MLTKVFKFKAKVWEWQGKGSWHFATVPVDVSAEINDLFAHAKRGWGSLPIKVTLGSSEWKTSIFPDTKTNTFVLPLKAAIRTKESVIAGDEVKITIQLTD